MPTTFVPKLSPRVQALYASKFPDQFCNQYRFEAFISPDPTDDEIRTEIACGALQYVAYGIDYTPVQCGVGSVYTDITLDGDSEYFVYRITAEVSEDLDISFSYSRRLNETMSDLCGFADILNTEAKYVHGCVLMDEIERDVVSVVYDHPNTKEANAAYSMVLFHGMFVAHRLHVSEVVDGLLETYPPKDAVELIAEFLSMDDDKTQRKQNKKLLKMLKEGFSYLRT